MPIKGVEREGKTERNANKEGFIMNVDLIEVYFQGITTGMFFFSERDVVDYLADKPHYATHPEDYEFIRRTFNPDPSDPDLDGYVPDATK